MNLLSEAIQHLILSQICLHYEPPKKCDSQVFYGQIKNLQQAIQEGSGGQEVIVE